MKKRKLTECLYHPFNQNKNNKRWTLLFVGDRGRTITFKRFKGLVVCVALAFMVSSALTFWFYYLYRNTAFEKQKLEHDLDNIRRVVMSLRDEKDILMARLIVTESRAEKAPVSEPDLPVGADGHANAAGPNKELKAEQKEAGESVSVNGFVIYHEPDINTLRVQYKINNTTPKNKPVTGRTVVVIKDNKKNPGNWLTLPAVKLNSGRPSGKKGKYFSISYFKTMRHRVNNQRNPDRFNTAVVYVFSKTGALLAENSFPVGIKLKTIQTSRKPKTKTVRKPKRSRKKSQGGSQPDSLVSGSRSPGEVNLNTPAAKEKKAAPIVDRANEPAPEPATRVVTPPAEENNAPAAPEDKENPDTSDSSGSSPSG